MELFNMDQYPDQDDILYLLSQTVVVIDNYGNTYLGYVDYEDREWMLEGDIIREGHEYLWHYPEKFK